MISKTITCCSYLISPTTIKKYHHVTPKYHTYFFLIDASIFYTQYRLHYMEGMWLNSRSCELALQFCKMGRWLKGGQHVASLICTVYIRTVLPIKLLNNLQNNFEQTKATTIERSDYLNAILVNMKHYRRRLDRVHHHRLIS
jgi:hypothetical protein